MNRFAQNMLAAIAEVPQPESPFTGDIVLVPENEFIIDRKSGIAYCTKASWDALKAATEPDRQKKGEVA